MDRQEERAAWVKIREIAKAQWLEADLKIKDIDSKESGGIK